MANLILRNHEIEKEVCEALNLPEYTVGFDLHAHAGEIWTITVEYAPTKEQAKKLIPILKKFKLVEIEE